MKQWGRESFSRFVAPVPLLAVIALVVHGRMIFSAADQMIAATDIGFYFQWLHTFMREELLSGRAPLWNPYTYCGTPFAANPQAAVFYPLNWLCLIVPVIVSQKLLIALHAWLAGAFMYGFLREVRIGRAAAFLGALPFMLGNYVMANASVGHLTMLYTLPWLALAMALCERGIARRQWRWLALGGAALGAQALAGEPQNSYYSALAVAIYGTMRSMWRDQTDDDAPSRSAGRRLAWWLTGLSLVAAAAAGAGAVQLLPAAEFALLSDRSGASFEFSTFFSMPPSSLMEFLLPWSDGRGWGMGLNTPALMIRKNWEFAGYVGLMTLALAAASFAVQGRGALRAARVLLIVALVLMLGSHTPLYRTLYDFLPGLSLFRVPARAIVIAHFALAAMAGFGADRLLRAGTEAWRSSRWRTAAILALGTFMAALILASTMLGSHWIVATPQGELAVGEAISLSNRAALVPLLCAAMTIFALIGLRWMSRPFAIVALAGAISIDLFISTPAVPLMTYNLQADPSVAYLKQLKERGASAIDREPFRVDLPGSFIMPNSAMAARVEAVNGYAPISIGRFFRFVHAMRGETISGQSRHTLPETLYRGQDPFPLRIMNVRFGAEWNPAQQQLRPAVVPASAQVSHAWIVHHLEVISDDEQALNRLRDPAFEPRSTVILHDRSEQGSSRGLQTSSNGVAKAIRVSPRELHVQTRSERDGYLVLSEMHYPGWKAWIDRARVEPVRANYLITALPLPAGEHEVVYRYEPASVTMGAAITLLTCAILLLPIARTMGTGVLFLVRGSSVRSTKAGRQ